MRKAIQKWISVKTIYENGIIECIEKYVKIIKVNPINYELKSVLEKEAILNSYKLFLKVCDFDMQILIKSRKENVNDYIKRLEKESKKQENITLNNIYICYTNYIKQINEKRNSSSKNFYICLWVKKTEKLNKEKAEIILKDNYLKTKEHLSRCGNIIQELNKEETEQLVYSFYNST